jgi:hypothetical protein
MLQKVIKAIEIGVLLSLCSVCIEKVNGKFYTLFIIAQNYNKWDKNE